MDMPCIAGDHGFAVTLGGVYLRMKATQMKQRLLILVEYLDLPQSEVYSGFFNYISSKYVLPFA